MKSWPLEKIPCLDFRAVTAIVQSMAQTELSRRSPLAFASRPPHEFASLRWEAVGLDGDALKNLAQQCNAMFHTRVPAPEQQHVCGDLSRQILAQWEAGERPVTFFTSGSTGMPKPCTHLESHLRQEITSVAPLVEDRSSALVTAPLHHMYGFTFGLLLPLSLGIPIRCVPPLPTMVEAQMRPGDMVAGIPLLWSQMVEMRGWQTGTSGAGQNITIFTATSPTPPEVMHALLRQNFRVIEFFGSSEVGVVCCRLNPDEAFELLPHVARGQGKHEGFLEREMPGGELMRYPVLDNITWTDERHLRPGARIDKAVQVGGVNVYPQHVALVLQEHEGVKCCLVRLMRPEEGYRLKAFVVPRSGWSAEALHSSLTRFARARLSDEQRPGQFTIGAEIPRGPIGKPTDW